MCGKLIRFLTGQQLKEDDAEAVNVARRIDLLAADLFRRRVGGCHHPELRSSSGLLGTVQIEDLADAEIEQFGHTIIGYQNVLWLEIAVDDQVLMSVLDS